MALSRQFRPSALLRASRAAFARPPIRQIQTEDAGLPTGAIRLHSVPQVDGIEYNKKIGKLFTGDAVNMAWFEYQDLVCQRLNSLVVADASLIGKPPLSVLLQTARNPDAAATFNYASMAWNNHFFFDGLLKTEPPADTDPVIKPDLLKGLTKTFSSIETLRDEMLATASAMFGPGFVWLVGVRTGSEVTFRLLTTYHAGTPHYGAHARAQSVDLNNHNPSSAEQLAKATVRDDIAPGGVPVQPLLCVNTWEHVWLRDYGVHGKDEYLDRWWKRIDWDKVARRTSAFEVMARAIPETQQDLTGSDLTEWPVRENNSE